ncbi:CdaR family protein [Staphylococcus lugdunensis]|uniref:CdaR family protein n=1 Tax=Staphylococcus lugdunensis TaxID=28035 RepID=UPI003169C4E2
MLENKWGLRFVAFILALFFYLSVNNVFGNIFSNNDLSQNSSKTIEDVPVQVIYNTKNLHVTKAPDTVDVTISGPQSKLLKIENADDIKVAVDLSKAREGNYKEDYVVKGLSNDINYNVKPKQAHVTLEDKVTRTMHVTPDISNNDIAGNYKVSEEKVSPETVKVTGGKEQLNQIAYLKATFRNANKIDKDTTDIADIAAFDKQLNKLNVTIQPDSAKLSVKVKPYSKKVKVNVKTVGSLPNNAKVQNIKLDDDEVELFGNRDDLANIKEVTAEIDLDDVKENTSQTVKFKLPDHVSKLDPSETNAEITIN